VTFDDRAAEHRARAELALRARRWSEAQSELEALLVTTPDDPMAWNELGVALERQGKRREAVEAYARSSALRPTAEVPGRNLINEMQRYLGFAAAIALFKIVDLLLHVLPLSAGAREAAALIALFLLALGALAYYQRRRDALPPETWRTYKSEMARTRRLRYGGIAFVFGGFLVFAVVLFVLVLIPGGVGDGTVVLVIVAGLCWLLLARILWRRVIAPRLEGRIDGRSVD
jgi:tetratricopeptide (TPR) repeat protein